MEYERLVMALRRWACTHHDIAAIGIAGSHARGAARPDSDIDVLILTTDPDRYLSDGTWLPHFGEVESSTHEDWGAVQAIRTFYTDGTEIEFGIALPSWADLDTIDNGTREVVAEGFRVVFDRDALLTNLIAAIAG